MMNNLVGVALAGGYVLTVIGVAMGLRRGLGWQRVATRKVIHIGVGMLSWLLPFLFDSALPFVAVCALFAVLLFFDTRYHFVEAMASEDDGNWGTVYFPLAAGTVAWLFWEQPPLMVAALMPLTWGDGMAEVVGRRFGRNQYTLFGHTRSLQGTAAFILFGLLFTALALSVMPGAPELTLAAAFAPAVVTVLLCAAVEAGSIGGLDNLLVTATAVATLSLWPF